MYLGGIYFWHCLRPAVHLRDETLLTDHLYSLMKHVYPHGCGIFQEDSAPIHRAQGLAEWFDEEKNKWESYFMALTVTRSQNEHLWEILKRGTRQHSTHHHKKHQMRAYLWKEWCSFPKNCRIYAKVYLFCLGSSSWPDTSRHFMMVAPPICTWLVWLAR